RSSSSSYVMLRSPKTRAVRSGLTAVTERFFGSVSAKVNRPIDASFSDAASGQKPARNDEALDLRGSLADLEDLGVPEQTGGDGVIHEPGATVDLDAAV